MDYARRGASIQAAFVDAAKRLPKGERLEHILWAGQKVYGADRLPVPRRGRVRGHFLSAKPGMQHGFDLKLDGWLELANGEHVTPLRTWYDERYEDVVEYPFLSRDGLLRVWNVYVVYRDGQAIEEKWTGNAGMLVEHVGDRERIYHCSHGGLSEPDFESLVFRISILE